MTVPHKTTKTMIVALMLIVSLTLLSACSKAPEEKAEPAAPVETTKPAAQPEPEAVVEDKCGGCHDTMRIYMPSYVNEAPGGADWGDVVTRMQEIHGAVLTDSEVASIVDYLSARTPDEAETLIKEKCTTCHDTTRIYNAAGDKTQWPQIITRMKEAHGLSLTAGEEAKITDFLQK